MATVQRYVNTASSGGDGTTNATSGSTAAYASLSSWEANSGGVATDHYIVDCSGTAADTTAVTVDFATNITSGSITIRGHASSGTGRYTGAATISTSHYRLSPTASASALLLSEANCTVDGIQVECQGGSFRAAINFIGGIATGSSCAIRNNRVRASGSCDAGIGTGGTAGSGSGTLTVENNLVVGFNLAGIEFRQAAHYSPTVTVRQNTVYGDGSSAGIQLVESSGSAYGTYTLKGNALANSGGSNCFAVTLIGGSIAYDDNATEDAQGTTGEIAIGTLANAWTSPGTGQSSDFTVKDSSSSLYAAVNPTLVSTDITGYTRDGTSHDVGAFELQAGGSSGPVGRADETDAALALAALQTRATGIATESDAALALAGAQARAVGLAVESDSALALSGLQSRAVGRADETDTALALGSGASGPVGVATESDAALALAGVQIRPVGRADEADTAFALTGANGLQPGVALETDAAFALAGKQIAPVGVAVEVDEALAPGSASVGPTPGGYSDDRKRRKKLLFVLERDGVLHYFDSQADLSAAQRRLAEVVEVARTPKKAKARTIAAPAWAPEPLPGAVAAVPLVAVRRDPEFADAYRMRGYEQILEMFRRAQEADEDDVEALLLSLL